MRGDELASDLPASLAKPALRALNGAGYFRLEQLTTVSEAELSRLHGLGPKALEQLRSALRAKGLSFAKGQGAKNENAVRIEPWGEHDLPLLEKLMGDPEMMEHLGGPESPEKIAERQARYERQEAPGKGQMFKVVHVATGEGVGSAGYWERTWQGALIYEIGWSVLPPFQGRGIASRATAQAIAVVKAEGKHRFLHAFPSISNPPSNAICRKLGFTLLGECRVEYPPGSFMRCNDWRLDLRY